jgi:hypothetical protein
MNRTITCLLLLCASAMAGAHEVRMHGPNGDGGSCPDPKEVPAAVVAPAAKSSVSAVGHAKAKAPPAFRAGADDDSSTHMPRWHSFLPGMFR